MFRGVKKMLLPRILILDDDKFFLEALKHALQRDYEVFCQQVTSAEEGKNLTFYENIDLVLLDVRLKEGDEMNEDGLIILEWLKKELPNLPVILMTAYGKRWSWVKIAKELGAKDYLTKPFDIGELKKNIKRILTELQK